MKNLLSAVLSFVVCVAVGLIAAQYVSAKLAFGIGFIAFVIVAGLTYPKQV